MKRALLVVAALTLLALGASWGANRGIASLLALPEGDALAQIDPPAAPAARSEHAPRAQVATGRSKREYIQGILTRNVFDHTKVGQTATVRDEGDIVVTDLDAHLIATIVASPASFSSALIAKGGRDGPSEGYGIGDRLFDAEIVRIEKLRVVIRRADGTEEVLEINDGEERRTSRPTGGNSQITDEEGIEKVSETEYNVDRELVDKYLNNLDSIQRLGRARIHRTNGEVDGYRLAGIRRNSTGWNLGIRNGDVVHAVNGASLASMGEAMQAFNSLQNESSFSFDITRKGQQMSLQYGIR